MLDNLGPMPSAVQSGERNDIITSLSLFDDLFDIQAFSQLNAPLSISDLTLDPMTDNDDKPEAKDEAMGSTSSYSSSSRNSPVASTSSDIEHFRDMHSSSEHKKCDPSTSFNLDHFKYDTTEDPTPSLSATIESLTSVSNLSSSSAFESGTPISSSVTTSDFGSFASVASFTICSMESQVSTFSYDDAMKHCPSTSSSLEPLQDSPNGVSEHGVSSTTSNMQSDQMVSVPPSVLCEGEDKVIQPPLPVKPKRKCGRPRNPVPRHKRESHINAEHRRRGKIQTAFHTLGEIVPRTTKTRSRNSKTDILFNAVDYSKELQGEIDSAKASIVALKSKKETLSLDVKAYTVLIQDLTATEQKQTANIDDLYKNFVQERSRNNWQFKVFTLVMRPLFDSFKMAVERVESMDHFVSAAWEWATNCLTADNLRAAFVNTSDLANTQNESITGLTDTDISVAIAESVMESTSTSRPSSSISMPATVFGNSLNSLGNPTKFDFKLEAMDDVQQMMHNPDNKPISSLSPRGKRRTFLEVFPTESGRIQTTHAQYSPKRIANDTNKVIFSMSSSPQTGRNTKMGRSVQMGVCPQLGTSPQNSVSPEIANNPHLGSSQIYRNAHSFVNKDHVAFKDGNDDKSWNVDLSLRPHPSREKSTLLPVFENNSHSSVTIRGTPFYNANGNYFTNANIFNNTGSKNIKNFNKNGSMDCSIESVSAFTNSEHTEDSVQTYQPISCDLSFNSLQTPQAHLFLDEPELTLHYHNSNINPKHSPKTHETFDHPSHTVHHIHSHSDFRRVPQAQATFDNVAHTKIHQHRPQSLRDILPAPNVVTSSGFDINNPTYRGLNGAMIKTNDDYFIDDEVPASMSFKIDRLIGDGDGDGDGQEVTNQSTQSMPLYKTADITYHSLSINNTPNASYQSLSPNKTLDSTNNNALFSNKIHNNSAFHPFAPNKTLDSIGYHHPSSTSKTDGVAFPTMVSPNITQDNMSSLIPTDYSRRPQLNLRANTSYQLMTLL